VRKIIKKEKRKKINKNKNKKINLIIKCKREGSNLISVYLKSQDLWSAHFGLYFEMTTNCFLSGILFLIIKDRFIQLSKRADQNRNNK
jgi:hypothetical protein